MKKDITSCFVFVDDFCKNYDLFLQAQRLGKQKKPTRSPELQISEMMTIMLLFHRSPAKNFKFFYHSYLELYCPEFPKLPSYNRFLELKPRSLGSFYALLLLLCALARKTGIAYIDSTPLPVCHNKRVPRHKVFKDFATLGKSSFGWFFGFKVHLIMNQKGELLSAQLTPGNCDDRKPVRDMTKKIIGFLFGDKGYIDHQLFLDLQKQNLKLITGIKANMKNKLMTLKEKILLRKRSIIQTVKSVLKKDFQISHTRHRSPRNAFLHIFSTLVAYDLKNKKPNINLNNLIPS